MYDGVNASEQGGGNLRGFSAESMDDQMSVKTGIQTHSDGISIFLFERNENWQKMCVFQKILKKKHATPFLIFSNVFFDYSFYGGLVFLSLTKD